jgi:hypothetical protein
MDNKNTSEEIIWSYPIAKVRFRKVKFTDYDGEVINEYEFQVFKRPYFWGTIGSKKWEDSIATNSYYMGLDFSCHLVKPKNN